MYDGSNNSKREVDGDENVYRGRAELVLVSPSDSYSELESISVGASGPSSCSTLHCLLTTFYLLP